MLKYFRRSSRQQKLNLGKKFRNVNLRHENSTCECIQRRPQWAILNRLGSLLVLTRDVNSEVLQAKEWSSRFQMTIVNMSTNASDCLANTAVEKAIVHINLGKKRSVLYIHGSLGCSQLFCTLPCCLKS